MEDGLNRRDVMRTLGVGALAFAAGSLAPGTAEAAPAAYELTPLPYGYDALAPTLEERIVRIHHDKHQAGYVKGLNATLAALEKARESGSMADVRKLSRDLAFNGSGDVLHILYWESMKPGAAAQPAGALAAAIERDFGSTEKLLAQFAAASKAVEGSGWGLLVHEPLGNRLLVLQAQNHENLAFQGCAPLACCDVWEHAYYLQYANDRGAYVDAFCKIIDWPGVARRYEARIK